MASRFDRMCVRLATLCLWASLTARQQVYGDAWRPEWRRYSNPPYRRQNLNPLFNGPRYPHQNHPFFPRDRLSYVTSSDGAHRRAQNVPAVASSQDESGQSGRWVFPGIWINDRYLKTANVEKSLSPAAFPTPAPPERSAYANGRWVYPGVWMDDRYVRTTSSSKKKSTSTEEEEEEKKKEEVVVLPGRTTNTEESRYGPSTNENAMPGVFDDEDPSADRDALATIAEEYPRKFYEAIQAQRERGATEDSPRQSNRRGNVLELIGKAVRDGAPPRPEQSIGRQDLVDAMKKSLQALSPQEGLEREDSSTGSGDGSSGVSSPEGERGGRGDDSFAGEEFGVASVVPVCKGSTFCVNPAEYPERLVNVAIERNNSLRLLANDDRVRTIVQKLSDDVNEVPLCRAHTQVVYPRSAESAERDWLYVVNQENFRQGVRVATCAEEGSDCGGLDDYLPGGYSVRCKQNYIYRELVAVLPDGAVVKRSFRLPTSCCCHREMTSLSGY